MVAGGGLVCISPINLIIIKMKGIFNRLLLGKTLTTKPAVVAAAGVLGGLFFMVGGQPKEEIISGGYKQAQNILSYLEYTTPEAEGAEAKKTPISVRFNHGAFMIPHFEKKEKGGEDAYVSTDQLLVVADGVGGWAQMGIDSGLFSKALVRFIDEDF